MKILLQGRLDLLFRYGGDSYLIKSLQKSLRENKIRCDIGIYSISNHTKIDIVHFFGIMRIHDLYPYFIQAKKQHKKIIVTPIYEDLRLLDEFGRIGWEKLAVKLLPTDLKELAKGLFRGIKDNRQLKFAFLQFKVPYSKQQKNLLSSADHIITTSYGEVDDLIKNFNLPKSKFSIIPICIKKEDYQVSKDLFVGKYGLTNFILSVGRIEPKKNQLGIISALKNTKVPLVFVGSLSQYHKAYAKEFLKQVENNSNIQYLGSLDRKMLISAYKSAKVHVLASWFEVLGIASMEAAVNGCNIVTTDKGYTKEYFDDLAWYCNPSKADSINRAVIKAYNSPHRNDLKNLMLEKYTWDKIIPQMLEVYEKVLVK